MERVPSIFIPTKSAIEGSWKFCSFNILGVAELNEIGKPNISNYRRIAYVAEPVKPSESDVATATILRNSNHQKAIEQNPYFAWSYFGLDKALHHQEKVEEAIASYQKAIKLNPNIPDFDHWKGEALTKQGKL